MGTLAYFQELLYPLGFLSTIPFFLRFLIQWLQSEKIGKSIVSPLFWRLSLSGNLLLFFHSLIQQQLPIFLAQGLSGLISLRNLSLMKNRPQKSSFTKTALLFGAILLCSTGLFFLPAWLFGEEVTRFLRVPIHAWQRHNEAPLAIHLVGIAGQALFSIRFVVQWWQAEQAMASTLSRQFWWISLSGGLLTLLYSIMIVDIVNILGPLCNLVPTVRNLILLKKTSPEKKPARESL